MEDRVVKWAQGKHGMIGIVISEEGDENKNWEDLHRTIAEVAIKNAQQNTEANKEAAG